MLVKKDCSGKTKSIYECDRCHKKIDTAKASSFKVSVRKTSERDREIVESWDLCWRCLNVIRTAMRFTKRKYLRTYYKKNRERLIEEKRNYYRIKKEAK